MFPRSAKTGFTESPTGPFEWGPLAGKPLQSRGSWGPRLWDVRVVDEDPKRVDGLARTASASRERQQSARWSLDGGGQLAVIGAMGRRRVDPSQRLRQKIRRWLRHEDTFPVEDDPSAIKMVVSSDCSEMSGHSACGVIDQRGPSCF